MTSAKASFPNEVMFTGVRGQGFNIFFCGRQGRGDPIPLVAIGKVDWHLWASA